MSAPTFKVGDRVRSGCDVGTVDELYGGWLRISGSTPSATWSMWVDPAKCVPAPPMSPQAKMVWHAMRAGAERTERSHWTAADGTTYRVHRYDGPYDGPHFNLWIEIALPPLAEDEAGR